MPARFGMAVKVSPLGLGIEAATPLTYRTNLRVGANAFSYSHGFNESGVNYNANLRVGIARTSAMTAAFRTT